MAIFIFQILNILYIFQPNIALMMDIEGVRYILLV
jgi:hypothetical protein